MSIVLDGTTGISGAVDLTTTGNTILGNASTDTLNVGNGDLIKDASGRLLVGVASDYTSAKTQVQDTSSTAYDGTGAGAGFSGLQSGPTTLSVVNMDTTVGTFAQLALITSGNSGAAAVRITAIKEGAATSALAFSTRNGTSVVEQMRIGGTGLVFTLPTYNNGTAAAANLLVASNGELRRSTSALKYKTNVRDLPFIDINKFRPVVYNSKCNGDNQAQDYFGLIADEVDAAGVKELVTYGIDGEVEGFQYERLTVVLLKAIQEQQALITSLTARLELLEAK